MARQAMAGGSHESPADRPACLYRTHGLAAVLGANCLAHQNRANCPFAAETQALQASRNEKLPEGIRQSAQEREKCETRNRELENADSAVTIRQEPGKPAANGGDKEAGGSEQPSSTFAKVPSHD
jgi:hypothetical protein